MGTWAEYLTRHMSRLGIDAAELSRRAGVSASSISRWRDDKIQSVSATSVRKIARGLDQPEPEALAAAGYTSSPAAPVRAAALTNSELLDELQRRLTARNADNDAGPDSHSGEYVIPLPERVGDPEWTTGS